jgi:hypothetical protein
MQGSDKLRGYCLEMICADFLAGAALETGESEPNIAYPTTNGDRFTDSEQTVSTETERNEYWSETVGAASNADRSGIWTFTTSEGEAPSVMTRRLT